MAAAIGCIQGSHSVTRNFRISNYSSIMIQLRRTYVSTGFGRSRKEFKSTHSTTLRKRPATNGDMDPQNAIELLLEKLAPGKSSVRKPQSGGRLMILDGNLVPHRRSGSQATGSPRKMALRSRLLPATEFDFQLAMIKLLLFPSCVPQ